MVLIIKVDGQLQNQLLTSQLAPSHKGTSLWSLGYVDTYISNKWSYSHINHFLIIRIRFIIIIIVMTLTIDMFHQVLVLLPLYSRYIPIILRKLFHINHYISRYISHYHDISHYQHLCHNINHLLYVLNNQFYSNINHRCFFHFPFMSH